jgi:ABC-2 type transport system ATP-binding protein
MIAINDLSFAYSKQQDLFKNLSLELKPGSITGLLGINGAGKTTLLKLLSGLLSNSNGNISVNDLKPFDRKVELLREIYFLPEEYKLPSVKISSFVKAQRGFYPKFDAEKFASILQDFELKSDSQIHKLSHGQKKKFLVSFALATNCTLLILDEPTNGLDIPSKAMFRRILAGSIDEQQLVVISTHQVKDVENLIDNIVILKDGSVVFHENTTTISEKLLFSSGRDADETSGIYSEPIPGGYKSISRQSNGLASDLDIELLFNAVNSGTKIFTDHGNK